jgi:HK97 gp10 family phage protein
LLNIRVEGDAELIRRFEGMSDEMRKALRAKTQILAYALQAKVTSKLHGEVLNKQTGALSRSIDNRVESNPTNVKGYVFSSGDVKYAARWEFGTGPYDIYPVKAKVLAFMIGVKQVFAKHVRNPGNEPRSFMRSSIADIKDEIVEGLTAALRQALKK